MFPLIRFWILNYYTLVFFSIICFVSAVIIRRNRLRKAVSFAAAVFLVLGTFDYFFTPPGIVEMRVIAGSSIHH
jgi:hypothetical protein